MPRFRLLFLTALLLSSTLTPLHAAAQYDDAEAESDAPTSGSAARLQVRINELEEQIRKLQGSLEQVSFSNRQLREQMDKMKGDIDYRLQALEKNTSAAPAPAPAASTAPAESTPPASKSPEPSSEGMASVPTYASPHEHYSAAFKLMNQAKYADAAQVFTAFTQRYPKDPLIGNAFYWLGETWYVRKDYVKAADNFRQGYESMPTGPKASDNLIKLAMSLSATNKNKEACVVLQQVSRKFGKTSASVRGRVETEMNRVGCH